MSVISSFSSSSSHLSSNLTLNFHINQCFRMNVSILVFSAFSITSFLLLPFYILVLYLGSQRSVSTSAASHSDLFIYHSIIMQLITLFGTNCCFYGGYLDVQELMLGGLYACSVTTVGQALLHILTCVERYLAVVHPVTYRSLRQMDRVRVRHVAIGCVWLAGFGWLLVCWLSVYALPLILNGCGMIVSLAAVSFFSLSVLCALRRPGPGSATGNGPRGGQSKQRAFHTIVVILGVLLLRFTGNLVINVIYSLEVVERHNYCVALVCLSWVDFPSSLVLPLLFLQRVGKLHCCQHKHQDEDRYSSAT